MPEGIPNGHVHVVKALVQETITNFSVKLADRKPEVGMRCRTVLQSKAIKFPGTSHSGSRHYLNVHASLAAVYFPQSMVMGEHTEIAQNCPAALMQT